MQNHNRDNNWKAVGRCCSDGDRDTSVCWWQPSREVALKKGQPCGDGMATDLGTFNGIRARWRTTFNFDS